MEWQSLKRIFLLLAGFPLAAVLSPGPLASANEDPPSLPDLWKKAIAVFQQSKDWIPGEISERTEMLTRHGNVSSLRIQNFISSQSEKDGSIRIVLVSASEDGTDISEKAKRKFFEREAEREKESAGKPRPQGAFSLSLEENPFNPDKQQQVRVWQRAETQSIYGRLCRRFDYLYTLELERKKKAERFTLRGMAWLDAESGVPYKIEFAPEPLPGPLKSLWTILLYSLGPDNEWLAREMRIEARARFLFFRKAVRTTLLFSNHWRPVDKSDASRG